MARFGDKLKSLRIKRGLTQEELAEILGTSKQVISRYENNLRSPKVDVVQDYAEKLNVSVMYFSDNSIPTAENIIPMPKMRKIPLIGTIACGTPILAVENIKDQVDVPEHIHADFALRCKGDSMIDADIQDGDIVYIRQQDEVDPGQIAAVLVEDEATLKRFYYDASAGVVTLVPANSAMPPQIYQGETLNHIKILGLAVGLTRGFKGLNYSCI